MADLDDFFAKKDKKKKTKTKFVSSELKQLEQAVSKEKEQTKNDETNEGTTNENDDKDEEWAEFEESKRPDLSNLKLGQLTFDEDHHNQNAGGADNESDYTNQYNNDGDNGENPWKKAQEQKTAGKEKPASEPVKPNTGVYVPRFGATEAAKSRKKNAPDLKSEEYFPSLGTDKPVKSNESKKVDGFKEVTHGVRSQSTASNIPPPLSSSNAYSTLFTED